MLTLAINTSLITESVALIDGRRVLAEASWEGRSDETQKLLPAIASVLKSSKCSFKNIRRIIVASGPGTFTALRIGVTVANILAFALDAPLFEINTEILQRSCAGAKSFGKAAAFLKSSQLKRVKNAIPRYSKPPNITLPRKICST